MPYDANDPLDRERQMIRRPGKWPHLVLPLVRAGNPDCAVFAPRVGLMTIAEDAEITIYLSNMFMDWTKAETKTYENVDALLADGWRVD